MSTKLSPSGSVFTRERRTQFASRVVTVSAKAANQAQQLAQSLQKLTALVEELSTRAATDPGGRGPVAARVRLFPESSLAMGRHLESQLRGLQQTIETLQSLARSETSK